MRVRVHEAAAAATSRPAIAAELEPAAREPHAIEARTVEFDALAAGTSIRPISAALYAQLVAFVRRQLGALRRWVEAEDLVQQVAVEYRLRARAGGPQLGPAELRAWLFQRLQWRMASLARKHARRRGETELGRPERVAARAPAEGSVTRADTRRLVRELIAALPEDYAAVVRLCALEERSVTESAAQLGLSEAAVRKRYSRARSALARRLAGLEVLAGRP